MTSPRLRYLPFFLAGPALFAVSLTGTQTADTVTLGKGNHTLKGAYVVPAGKKLEIKSGAVIVADKNAALDVKGSLIVEADVAAPAIVKGAKWRGIHAAETSTVELTGLQVSNADIGLNVEGPLGKLDSCVFAKNVKGVKLDGKGQVAVVNCLIADNADYGMRLTRMSGTIDKCSFLRNKNFGLTLGETNPKLTGCLFADNNGGGIEQSNASSSTGLSGTGCAFEGKALAMVSSMSHGSIEFTQCWWGDKNTSLLKAKGDKAILPNVKDARNGGGSLKVYWAGFLTAAPKPVGADVKSKL